MLRKKLFLVIAPVLIAGVFAWRLLAHRPVEGKADSVQSPVAAMVRVERRSLGAPLTLAGAFKPFQDIDVHAKVAGYVKEIYVDVGSHVREGQMLAVLEVPELVAQVAGADATVRRSEEDIRRAQADLERAKSARVAIHEMYMRLDRASEQKQGLVAQQDVDDAEAKDLEAGAQVSSSEASLDAAQQGLQIAQATQKRYAALSDYTRITAPYAGVVTVRYADKGSLIAAGTSESRQAEPIVRLAQISVLRLVLPIPESIAARIRLGDPIKVHVQALNQDYVGTVSRFADALDEQTRTMHTEIDFQNSDGKLLPGMYVQASVPPAVRKDVLTVPLEAVDMNGSDGTVLVVNSQNELEERNIHLGLEGSTHVEVLSGLTEGERVVIGSRNEFRKGMKVIPKQIDASEPGSAGGK
jgi:RND family efflux transporter MFP subunit